MRGTRFGFSIIIALFMTLALWGSGISVTAVQGAEDKKDLPPRAISIAPAYTGVIVPEGDDASVDLDVKNGGRQDEDIEISFTTVPENWDAVDYVLSRFTGQEKPIIEDGVSRAADAVIAWARDGIQDCMNQFN